MPPDEFRIETDWGLEFPFFVRKIDRISHWSPNVPPADRTARIVEKVFQDDDGKISVFRVASTVDVKRVSVALNARRKNRPEEIAFVPIATADLGDVRAENSPGETDCHWANRLHFDLLVANDAQAERIVERMLANGRGSRKFSKSEMNLHWQTAQDDRCRSVRTADSNERCACETALTPGPSPLRVFTSFAASTLRWMAERLWPRRRV